MAEHRRHSEQVPGRQPGMDVAVAAEPAGEEQSVLKPVPELARVR